MFKDRDYLITKEGIIFRVYGYIHPLNKAVCDVEYAPESLFISDDPRSLRFLCKDNGIPDSNKYYKFIFDGGLQFIKNKYPDYQVDYEPLNTKLVGLNENQVKSHVKPHNKLNEIVTKANKDSLLKTMNLILDTIFDHSSLKLSDFGCFGSICLDFYHIKYSDIDLIIYGKKELDELRKTLAELYKINELNIVNEFDSIDLKTFTKSSWKFKNYSLKEYVETEKKKLIYSVINSPFSNRQVKIEFEPVKKQSEIKNNYEDILSIENLGWIEVKARILDDSESYYLQSIYKIEVINILKGLNVEINWICNYLEEFRGAVQTGDIVIVKGYLEKVICKKNEYYQVTISYGMKRHSEQVLKLFKNSL